jgi:hypothetical protein
MKKSSALLGTVSTRKYQITMTLTGNERAEFNYTNELQAREHYLQLGATMSIAGQAIKNLQFQEIQVD